MSRERLMYSTYELLQLLPVQGWQAVYLQDGAHFLRPVYALALAEETTHVTCEGQRVGHRLSASDQRPSKMIVGVTYNPVDGWEICDETSNFCGLLVPGVSLQQFIDDHWCVGRDPSTEKAPFRPPSP